MEGMEDSLEIQAPQPAPSRWGADPCSSPGRGADLWWYSKDYQSAYKAVVPDKWESLWAADGAWDDPQGPATMALRAILYRVYKNDAKAIESLTRALQDGTIPERPMDLWKEAWARNGFIRSLAYSDHGTIENALFEAVLDRWPWAVEWMQAAPGQQSLPQILVRKGKYGQADRLMDSVPFEHYFPHYETREGFYDVCRLWRDRDHWFKQDPSWLMRVAKWAPQILSPHPATGLGPLEQACRDHLPELVGKLLDAGLIPDPEKSFGLNLTHWAVVGLSEFSWDHKSGQWVDKSPEEIEKSALACGKMLAFLIDRGFSAHDPVVKMKPVKGRRRPPRLPKHPETAYTGLAGNWKGKELAAETVARVQSAVLAGSAPPPPAPSPRARTRL